MRIRSTTRSVKASCCRALRGDWGWRTNVSQRNAGNFTTPNQGVIANTGEHETNGDGTLQVRKDWGDVTANASHWDKNVQLQNGFVLRIPCSTLSIKC